MNTEAVCLSVIGSVCIQLLELAELRGKPVSERPDFKDFAYYLPYVIFPLISGVIGYAYFEEQQVVNKLLAMQLGASAPLLFKNLSNSIPDHLVTR